MMNYKLPSCKAFWTYIRSYSSWMDHTFNCFYFLYMFHYWCSHETKMLVLKWRKKLIEYGEYLLNRLFHR